MTPERGYPHRDGLAYTPPDQVMRAVFEWAEAVACEPPMTGCAISDGTSPDDLAADPPLAPYRFVITASYRIEATTEAAALAEAKAILGDEVRAGRLPAPTLVDARVAD